MAHYDEAIRIDPNAIAFNNRGSVYNQKGDFDRAIASLDVAILLNPKYAIAFNNRGFAHLQKRNLDRAIADLDEAIRLNPKFSIAYGNRGVAYRRKGDLDRAAADFQRQREAQSLERKR